MDYNNLPQKIIDKFWASIEKTDNCWNWLGKVDSQCGIPLLAHKRYSSRRISLTLAGKPLPNKQLVLPMCKNHLCVNPDHLVVGNEARFYSKIQKLSEKDGSCWAWLGQHDRDMYGIFSFYEEGGGKRYNVRAHIYSWELRNKWKVRKGMVIMHLCDHPWCVNPNHLSLGTPKDNTQDMIRKERGSYGEKNGSAKLTVEKVKEIRSLYATGGYTRNQLSDLFGISISNIDKIISFKLWKKIK